MYVLNASHIIRTAWRTSPAMSETGQDIGIVYGFLRDFLLFLDLASREGEKIVVVFSEYPRDSRKIEPERFNRFFPRSERELLQNYDIMRQFLFSLFDNLPCYAINSKILSDYECARLLCAIHEAENADEPFTLFTPFDEYINFQNIVKNTVFHWFGDDMIPKTSLGFFRDETGFDLRNSAIYYSFFGGKYTKRTVPFQKRTLLKQFPDLATRQVCIDEVFSPTSQASVKILSEVASNRDKIEAAFSFYVGRGNIKDSHLKNVGEYLKQKKKFNETKFVVSAYKLGLFKQMPGELELLTSHFRRISERL